MDKVSVIMPAYNAARYISESIESVLKQTYSNWELIIVDDGSTDTTKAIVSEYMLRDKRIKYYWQPNGKQGKARNLGLLHSTGEYVAFLDADDLWMPEKLSIQVQVIQGNNYDVIFSDGFFVGEDSMHCEKDRFNISLGEFKGKQGLISFLEFNRIPILTALVKKAVLEEVKFFEEKLAIQNSEDYHLWLKVLKKGFVCYGIDMPLAKYRRHSAAVTINSFNHFPSEVETLKSFSFEDVEIEKIRIKSLKVLYNRLLVHAVKQNNKILLVHYVNEMKETIGTKELVIRILKIIALVNVRIFEIAAWRLI